MFHSKHNVLPGRPKTQMVHFIVKNRRRFDALGPSLVIVTPAKAYPMVPDNADVNIWLISHVWDLFFWSTRRIMSRIKDTSSLPSHGFKPPRGFSRAITMYRLRSAVSWRNWAKIKNGSLPNCYWTTILPPQDWSNKPKDVNKSTDGMPLQGPLQIN